MAGLIVTGRWLWRHCVWAPWWWRVRSPNQGSPLSCAALLRGLHWSSEVGQRDTDSPRAVMSARALAPERASGGGNQRVRESPAQSAEAGGSAARTQRAAHAIPLARTALSVRNLSSID